MIRKMIRLTLLLLLGLFPFAETKPKTTFNVRNFGTTGDGITKDTCGPQKIHSE